MLNFKDQSEQPSLSIQHSNTKHWNTYILKSFRWSLFANAGNHRVSFRLLQDVMTMITFLHVKFRLQLKCLICENPTFKAKISLSELSYSQF